MSENQETKRPKTEYIKGVTLAARLGISPPHLTQITKKGIFERDESTKLYEWPRCRDQYKSYTKYQKRPYAGKDHTRIPFEKPEPRQPNEEYGNEELNPNAGVSENIEEELTASDEVIRLLTERRDDTGADAAYKYARSLNEVVKSKRAVLDLLNAEGKTIQREAVETWLYTKSRQNRDMWLNWPSNVAVEMAERLGVDNRLLNDLLLEQVRKQLDRIATIPETIEPDFIDIVSEGSEAADQD